VTHEWAGPTSSKVTMGEAEPTQSGANPTQGTRMLRVEVRGLLHDWFDVEEMGEMVRSASFAVTLRENIARYFGVPVKNQALYDEDGLLTTNADLLRTLQRVNPMLYVHDVKDMSAQLRDHTEKELAFIDAEVEQSRRNLRLKGHTMRFGASDTQLRPDQMLEGVCEENSGNTGEPIAEGINVSKEPLANGMDQWQGQVGAAPSGTGSTTAMSSAHVEASSIATVDDAHCPSLAAPATLSAQMLASMATPARSPGARGHLAEIPVEVACRAQVRACVLNRTHGQSSAILARRAAAACS